jgi:hypothetical protein
MKLAAPLRFLAAAAVASVLTICATDAAAATRRGVPPGLIGPAASLEAVARVEMPAVDVAAHLAEDAARESTGVPAPLRFAARLETALTPATAGTWQTLDDSSSLWRVRIASPGALSLNLGLDRFELPAGAALWLYDADGAMVQGPYTCDDRNAEGELWTALVPGDELVVELHVPAGVAAGADLRIAEVNHGYRDLGGPTAAPKQGSCNIDVICPDGDGWRDQIRATARITIAGIYLCTGQLVNNTAQDGTPYFLTAQHCVEDASAATTVVAYWNYESPVCGQLSGGSLADNQSGATLVSLWEYETGSDFALIRLNQIPDASFNVHYAGWDASGTIPPGSVGIHHPNGDEKAISFNDDPLAKVNFYGFGNHQWRISEWEEGTTEGGSSGSCLYNPSNGLCVGTLSAGTASCGNPTGFDIYGRMDAHWIGDGSSSGRLVDWLDPLGTGALTLAGADPGGLVEGETWLIPAAASAPGVGTSNWKTTVVISNPTSGALTARIYFVEKGAPWPGSLLSGPHTVPAGGSLFRDDPLAALNPTSGLLYVTLDGDGGAVTTRTYNLAAGGATFGQGIPGILLDEAVASERYILPMLMSEPGRFRTNLGIVQTSGGSMAVRVQVHAPNGTILASRGYSSTSGYLQVNNLLDSMGIGGTVVRGGWISVDLIAGSPSYWTCYASIVDADTDDPTYVLPLPG